MALSLMAKVVRTSQRERDELRVLLLKTGMKSTQKEDSLSANPPKKAILASLEFLFFEFRKRFFLVLRTFFFFE